MYKEEEEETDKGELTPPVGPCALLAPDSPGFIFCGVHCAWSLVLGYLCKSLLTMPCEGLPPYQTYFIWVSVNTDSFSLLTTKGVMIIRLSEINYAYLTVLLTSFNSLLLFQYY